MSKDIKMTHDRFWRYFMQHKDIAKEFLQFHLPEKITQHIDLDSIKVQPDTFIENNLRSQITDLLYKVQFKSKPGYIYTLVEHQSTPDNLMPFRLLKYVIAIMDRHLKNTKSKTLPVVFPLVVYTGKKPYNISQDIFDLFGDHKELAQNSLLKPHKLIDFNKITDDELKQFIYQGVIVKTMKHIYDENVLPVFKQFILPVLSKFAKDSQSDYICAIINYIMQAGQIADEEEFTQLINEHLPQEIGENIMTFEQICINKGITKGINQGLSQGINQGIDIGAKKMAEKVVLNLVNEGETLERIAKVTNLSLEEVERIQQKLQ